MFFAENLNFDNQVLAKFTESFRHILAAILGVDTTLLKKFDELDPLYFKLFLLLPNDSDQELTMDFILTILGNLRATDSMLVKIDLKKVRE
jgi:hypothetical protein